MSVNGEQKPAARERWKRPPRRLVEPLAAALMAAAIVLLAALQYRWISEVSQADRARLARSLRLSADRFRNEFYRELLDVGAAYALRPGSAEELRREVLERDAAWRELEGGLPIAEVWLVLDGDTFEVLRLDRDSGRLVEEPLAALPVETPLRRLEGPGRRGRGPGPLTWVFLPESAALWQPLYRFRPPEPGRRPEPPERVGGVLLRLDLERLRQELFPELAERAFGRFEDAGFRVAVLEEGREEQPEVLFALGMAGREELAATEARWPLLPTPEEAFARSAERLAPLRRDLLENLGRFRERFEDRRPERRPPLVIASFPGSHWTLAAAPAEGSLQAAVQRLRRRNLRVSGAVLAVLAGGFALTLLSARRARRLARIQMDFIAGVSHELRTPLAVIRSAADNLADGVVAEPEQIRRYGALIRDEGRRLSGMVEQTLEFAAFEAGRRRVQIERLSPADLLGAARREAEPAAAQAGCELEMALAPDLPDVRSDRLAAGLVLRNLIQNALKYGGAGGWVGLRAMADSRSVSIQVEDRGPGLDPRELPHLFEPFFRGRAATAAQLEGAGLGLRLAREAATAVGAELTAANRPEGGAIFTLRLPAVPDHESVRS